MSSRTHVSRSVSAWIAALPEGLGSTSSPADFGERRSLHSVGQEQPRGVNTHAPGPPGQHGASSPGQRAPSCVTAAPDCLPGGRHRLFWKLATDKGLGSLSPSALGLRLPDHPAQRGENCVSTTLGEGRSSVPPEPLPPTGRASARKDSPSDLGTSTGLRAGPGCPCGESTGQELDVLLPAPLLFLLDPLSGAPRASCHKGPQRVALRLLHGGRISSPVLSCVLDITSLFASQLPLANEEPVSSPDPRDSSQQSPRSAPPLVPEAEPWATCHLDRARGGAGPCRCPRPVPGRGRLHRLSHPGAANTWTSLITIKF